MIKVCIFNKSNNISRVYDFKKFFQCIDSEISLTHCTDVSAVDQNMLNREYSEYSNLKDDDEGQSSTEYMPVQSGNLVLVW